MFEVATIDNNDRFFIKRTDENIEDHIAVCYDEHMARHIVDLLNNQDLRNIGVNIEAMANSIKETEKLISKMKGDIDLERIKEMEELLRSAYCIATRNGEETNWELFAKSITELGIGGPTDRTYKE